MTPVRSLLCTIVLACAPVAAAATIDDQTLLASYCLGVSLSQLDSLRELDGLGADDLSGQVRQRRHEADRLHKFVYGRIQDGGAGESLSALRQGQADYGQATIDLADARQSDLCNTPNCVGWLTANSAAYQRVLRCEFDNGMPY